MKFMKSLDAIVFDRLTDPTIDDNLIIEYAKDQEITLEAARELAKKGRREATHIDVIILWKDATECVLDYLREREAKAKAALKMLEEKKGAPEGMLAHARAIAEVGCMAQLMYLMFRQMEQEIQGEES